MNDQLKRVGWIEVLRAVAMLMVVVPHFIASFCPEVFVYWQTHSLFLKGISGKHGVAIFCVLLGYVLLGMPIGFVGFVFLFSFFLFFMFLFSFFYVFWCFLNKIVCNIFLT